MVAEDHRPIAERCASGANAPVASFVGERLETIEQESCSFHSFTTIRENLHIIIYDKKSPH
jgi:hypothetical protein